MSDPITEQQLEDAAADATTLALVVNNAPGLGPVISRLGTSLTALSDNRGTPPLEGGPVRLALAGALAAFTYNNSAGTITGNSNAAIGNIDSVSPSVNDRIWFWDYTGAGGSNVAYGVYTLTQVGSGSLPFILTRATDANTGTKLDNAFAYVKAGTVNGGLTIQCVNSAIVLGTTALVAVVVSGNSAVGAETTRATAAEAAELARATSVEAGITKLVGNVSPAYTWQDDDLFQWGVFDVSGNPLLACTVNTNKLVGSCADYLNVAPTVGSSYAWADDGPAASATMIVPPLYPTGVLPTIDANGNIVISYGASPGPLDDFCHYVNKPDGSLRATNADPANVGTSFMIASTRGNATTGGISGILQMGGIVKFVDDATASGNAPLIERRQFNMNAGAYLTNLGGITKLVHVIDIGHSLTVGAIATTLLTTTPFFSRGVMFNGGPKVAQSVSGWNAPPPIIADGYNGQMQQLLEYYEFQNSNGQGETHGGGVVQWASAGNIASNEAILFSTVGGSGAVMTQLLSGTTMSENMVRVAERSAAIAALNGWGWECYVTCSIGENDFITYQTVATGFQTNIAAFQTSMETAIKAVYTANGFSAPTHVPLFVEQPSSWTCFYSLATCALAYAFPALARSSPNAFKLIGPEYYTDNYASGTPAQEIHKTALGYKLDGQYMMRAVAKYRASAANQGVYITGASNSLTTLTITTSAASNLAIDTSVVTDPNTQKGLRCLDTSNGNANVALSSIAVSSTSITATGTFITGHVYMIGAGDIGTIDNVPGPTTGPRTCFRDSSTDVSSTDTTSTPMYNYLCHDQFLFTAS